MTVGSGRDVEVTAPCRHLSGRQSRTADIFGGGDRAPRPMAARLSGPAARRQRRMPRRSISVL
jgi:hypothetical protein